MDSHRYALRPDIDVWCAPDLVFHPGGSEKNGELARLRAILDEVRDTSVGSEELLAHISDWSTRLCFSPERANVLRPLAQFLRGRVLEVGAGCGAITRFLGEAGGEVVALEPDLQQAALAAARCRGLENVRVVCDRLESFAASEPFDCIVMVGAFERKAGPRGSNRAATLLDECRSRLGESGVLALALDNRLALRYFAGSPEDLTGRIFYNLGGGPDSDGPQLLGKVEVETHLAAAGFGHCEFLYPLPDYRHARMLLHPAAFNDPDIQLRELVYPQAAAQDHRKGFVRLFSERVAWDAALRNGVAEGLTNSFVVLAGMRRPPQPYLDRKTLVYSYAVLRRSCYRKMNKVMREDAGLSVQRVALSREPAPRDVCCRQEICDEKFLSGRIYANVLYELLDTPGWKLADLFAWAVPYYRFLQQHMERRGSGAALLPEKFLDCTPSNLMLGAEGGLTAFDLEWIATERPELRFVLFRGLLYALGGIGSVARPGDAFDMGVLSLVQRIFHALGEAVPDTGALEELLSREDAVQNSTVGAHATLSRSYWQCLQLTVRPDSVLEPEPTGVAVTPISGEDPHDAIERLTRKARTYQEMLRDRDEQIAVLATGFSDSREQSRRLTDELGTVRETLAAVEHERNTLRHTRDAGAEELSITAERAARMKIAVATLQDVVADRDKQISRLLATVAERDASTNRLLELVAETRNTDERLIEERDSAITHLRVQAESAEVRIAELENRLRTVQEGLAERERDVDELTRQLGALRTAEDAGRLQIASLSTALAEREKTIAQLTGEVKRHCATTSSYQNRIADLQRSEAEQKRTIGRLRDELTDLHSTFAWKLTIPFTVLTSGLRAARARVLGLLMVVHYAWLALPGRRAKVREWMAMISQSGCFDVSYYLRTNPEVERMRINPQVHYLIRGARQGRAPNPLFDPEYYIGLRPEAALAGVNPLVDFLKNGLRLCVNPHPLFDVSYYLQHNPDIAVAGCNPLAHYLASGDAEGRSAHPLFDGRYYLDHALDVSQARCGALMHYLTSGAAEARDPHPLFDTSYYLKTNPDVARSGINPLIHYVRWGAGERRGPHPLFNLEYYCEQSANTEGPLDDPIQHYMNWGAQAGLSPHPLFRVDYYLDQAGPMAAANPLLHYLAVGAGTFDPHPLFDTSYYLEQVPEIKSQGPPPLVHYIEHGVAAGRDPHPLFSTAFYLELYPELAGTNLLLHYLRDGAREGRDPHPLFDTSFYLERYPEVALSGENPLIHFITVGSSKHYDPHPLFCSAYYIAQNQGIPLNGLSPIVHYIRIGALARKNPHPLFDTGYYLEHTPEAAQCGMNALMHYLWRGSQQGRSPHPLFQTEYYLRTNADVRDMDGAPLIQFLQYGGFEGRNPHPLFHCDFYLTQYPDVAARRINPLVDYIVNGASAGRDPNPMFDTSFYLEENPDVSGAGVNPLVHYILNGADEGRPPHPKFDVIEYTSQYPVVTQKHQNVLEHYFEMSSAAVTAPLVASPASPARSSVDTILVRELRQPQELETPGTLSAGKTVVCLSHVAPCPPRAGNEYRIERMLRHLQSRGYRVVLVMAPLGGKGISDRQFLAVAKQFPNLLLCNGGNELVYHLESGSSVVRALQGRSVESFSTVLGESDCGLDADQVNLDRSFCSDFLIQVVRQLCQALGDCVLLSEYIFMSRLMPLMDRGTLKIIDTHDVFSTKGDKVVRFGVEDTLVLTPEQERIRLLRADLVLAIQRLDHTYLADLTPERKVIEVAVDFDVEEPDSPPAGHNISYIASDNSMNVKGLRDFLRFAWPLISRDVPDAQLYVAGSVSEVVHTTDDRVHLLGKVERIDSLYRAGKVVINPSIAGTGLKVKTVEAVCHFRPVVTWPSGVEGMDPELSGMCLVAEDWYQFSQLVTRALLDADPNLISRERQERIRRAVNPDAVYGCLCNEIEQFYMLAPRPEGERR